MKKGIECEKALELWLGALDFKNKVQGTEMAGLLEAEGRILAEDLYAKVAVPSFPRSAMDGYCVRSSDLAGKGEKEPVVLQVMGENLAGDYNEIEYKPGTAVRVMTGGYVPEGYDAVVRQEDTDYGESEVKIFCRVKPYMNYCRVGEDIEKGSLLIRKGTILTPAHIGIGASVGCLELCVKKKLRVVILATGSELSRPGEALRPGSIYNNSAYMLGSSLKRAGLELTGIEMIADDEALLTEVLYRAVKENDIVITTGAVSVGKRDIMEKCLLAAGAEVIFSRCNIQPGTPTIGSVLGGKPVLSLSGNPYAAYANFEMYFWDLAAEYAGCEGLRPKPGRAVLRSDYEKVNKHRRLIRAYEEGGFVYLNSGVNASSVISNMTECNCFIDLEAGRQVSIGDEVRIRRFR